MLKPIKELNKYKAYSVYEIPTDGSIPVKFLDANRIPTDRDVGRLKKALKKCNLLHLKPVIAIWIKGVLWLVDGQHRYLGAKVLGKPIYVIALTEYNPEWMAFLNSNQQNWKLTNYAKMWSMNNKKSKSSIYTKFLEYYSRYTITSGVLVALFNNEVSRKIDQVLEFKNGELVSTHLKNVEEKLSKLDSLRYAATNPTLLPSTLKKQQFQQAILQALAAQENNQPSFSFEKFMYNLSRSRHQFNMLAKQVDMLTEIFRIERKK